MIFALVRGGTVSLTLAPDRSLLQGDFDGRQELRVGRGSLELTRRT